MALEDTLRMAEVFPMEHLEDAYDLPEPPGDPNWAWLDLWEQENPSAGKEGFNVWWEERQKVHARVWVAWCLPQFRVWDWPDEDVARAIEITRRHVCGVCGRPDDAGCAWGC